MDVRRYPTGFVPKFGQTRYKLIDIVRVNRQRNWTIFLQDEDGRPRQPSQSELMDKIHLDSYLIFQCENGHRGQRRAERLMQDRRCRQCPPTRRFKYCLEDLQLLARDRAGICHSAVFVGAAARYSWECRKGHRWEAAFKDVKNKGTWCPVCAAKLKGEARRK